MKDITEAERLDAIQTQQRISQSDGVFGADPSVKRRIFLVENGRPMGRGFFDTISDKYPDISFCGLRDAAGDRMLIASAEKRWPTKDDAHCVWNQVSEARSADGLLAIFGMDGVSNRAATEIGLMCGLDKRCDILVLTSVSPIMDTDNSTKFALFNCLPTVRMHWSQDYCLRDREQLAHLIGAILASDAPRFESPLEQRFFECSQLNGIQLVSQFVVGPYRLDLAMPERKIAVEIDGHEFHSTREQRTNDARRQRQLEGLGWRVVRFTGTEIHRDLLACVLEFKKLIAN